MSVNADQTFSGDSIFENIYVHGKLVAPEEAVSIFRKILSKEGITITGDGGLLVHQKMMEHLIMHNLSWWSNIWC
ncbi:MAG: hypothetical protein CM15mV9_2080 [uncultured marine virus]|nr:MAG: hypothetical protein CM15mV9_2080 [uncultured marine virus]